MYAVHEGGAFMQASDATQMFAQLKYHIRGTTFYEVLANVAHHQNNLLKATYAEASQAIADDIPLPYNTVGTYQKHATHIVKNSEAPPTTRVDNDSLHITYKEDIVDLPKWDGQGIWTADRRLKTEGITDTDSFIPAKCPPQLSRILERYILLVRPFETTLVQIVHGQTDPGAVQLTSQFLCIQEGQKVSETTVSCWIKDFFKEHCHVSVGSRQYRQVAIEIIKVFLGSEHLVNEKQFDTLARQFGHLLAVLNKLCQGSRW
ncbi:hypothetical protein M422DRAFT_257290 [Sphaerobolus stellatus SS14]|uniref:Uncharacterized protein n=1 Tax=Sphaerobolus stellatus (strain SS14) TaxID=990650 RepID=A0A0C9VPC1_SPHS4|nr:hypothetical protein M422DRAFT_257290 [Sphaerobolus stellatus SS14]